MYNRIQFLHREQCISDDCSLPPLDGDGVKICHAYFVKYYFNNATKTCQTFVYGGCGGNANRFSSEQSCLDTCL